MTTSVVLDAGPLGLLAHTNSRSPETIKCAEWLQSLLRRGVRVCIPDISDYEVRRSLLKINSTNGITKLDQLIKVLHHQRITTRAMHQAADCWAQARKIGKPTADDKALDGDMVLIGQAKEIEMTSGDIIIATTNVKHIEIFADAREWSQICAEDLS